VKAGALLLLGASTETVASCVEAQLAFRTIAAVEDAPAAGSVIVVELGSADIAAIVALDPAWVVAIIDDPGEGARALAAGADEVILRPVRANDLLLRTEPRRDLRRTARHVAHELNNLLSVIGGCARFLGGELEERDPLRREAAHIERASQQAEALARRLLALGRRKRRSVVEVDLAETLKAARATLRRSLGAQLLLRLDAREVPRVRLEPEPFEQLLLELATQVRDAVHGGGTVAVSTSLRTIDAGTAAREGIPAGTYVSLGMAAPALPRTGMLSAEIGRVGGFVLIEGNALAILLPPIETADTADTKEAKSNGAATVLLVDDDPLVRNGVRRDLERAGFTVVAAAGPAEALELAERHEGELDVLLTDLLMPGMNGLQLARCIEQLRESIAVVYMTGQSAMAVSLGSSIVLHKPIEPQALIASIRRVSRREKSR
jgi:CheY-like chemotaxis protein